MQMGGETTTRFAELLVGVGSVVLKKLMEHIPSQIDRTESVSDSDGSAINVPKWQGVKLDHLKTGTSVMKITTIGIDQIKSVFQLHGVDPQGKTMLKKKLPGLKMLAYFANLLPCFVGIQA